MAVIHRTTLKPTKLELLADWLPRRPWFTGGPDADLAVAGGFRLDDPAGAVGIECMVVTDASGAVPVAYHVPMAYRDAPLDGAEDALIGLSEHGVLGRRWFYDAAHDPVSAARLYALLAGTAAPQHQKISDTPEPGVTVHGAGAALPAASFGPGPTGAVEGAYGTEIPLRSAPRGRALRVVRVLRPTGAEGPEEDRGPGAGPGGSVVRWASAAWSLPDGSGARGVVASLATSDAGGTGAV